MIVNSAEKGWQIIFQRNHALLAGAIACEINPAYRPPHWIETLSAILEHDDGLRDWHDGKHLDEHGHPLDFSQYSFDASQASRVIQEAHYKSSWITLLISMHTAAQYSGIKNQSALLQHFLHEQATLQQNLKDRFALTDQQAGQYYNFLRWCDALSLILCRNVLTDTPTTIGPLMNTQSHVIYKSQQPGVLHINPWCFSAYQFVLEIEMYELPQRTFCSHAALQQCLAHTPPKLQTWRIKKDLHPTF